MSHPASSTKLLPATQRQMLDAFILDYYDMLYRCANRACCYNKALAEDFTQQCILKLYEGVERGHPQTIDKTTVGYAIRTLRSVVNDYFRKDIRERSAHERAETSMAGRSADDPGNRVADRDQVLWFLQSGS